MDHNSSTPESLPTGAKETKKNVLTRLRRSKQTISIGGIQAETGMSEHSARRWAKKHLVPSFNRTEDDHAEISVTKFVHHRWVKANGNTLGIAKIGESIFHIEKDPQKALRYIIRTKEDGLTAKEASLLLRHDMASHFEVLEKVNAYIVEEEGGEQVWVYRLTKLKQVNHRRTNRLHNFRKQEAEQEVPIAVPVDEVIDSMAHLYQVTKGVPLPYIFEMALLKHSRGWSDRRASRELKHAVRQDRAAARLPRFHHSTLSRKFRQVDEVEMIEFQKWLVQQLVDRGVMTGETLAIDSTHIEAYCSRKKIDKGGVEGAAWGVHQGDFYGYKIHAGVDSDSELPFEFTLTPGKDHDVTQMEPLADKVAENHPEVEIQLTLADAAYDAKHQKAKVSKKLGCAVVTAKNPRQNALMKWAKKLVSKMWAGWGGKLKSVAAYLNRLPQKLLTAVREAEEHSLLAELIRNLMFMDRRVAVERFFSRLRAFTMADKLVHQNLPEVRKFIRWAVISMLAFALAMVEMGIPKNKLRLGHIV